MCIRDSNINVEMNYWLAEAGNLSECHLPLMRLIRELSIAGKQTAKEYYHSAGWVTHHNTDLWRSTEPSCEDASWSWWPLGGGWLCEHIWQHYEYTGDKKLSLIHIYWWHTPYPSRIWWEEKLT